MHTDSLPLEPPLPLTTSSARLPALTWGVVLFASILTAACGTTTPRESPGIDGGEIIPPAGCALTAQTTATSTVTNGCALLNRDTSGCASTRSAAGLTGAWLKFSCRVQLAMVTSSGASYVQASSDSRPDYKSNYYEPGDACYEAYTTKFPDPSLITTANIVMNVPLAPNASGRPMGGLGAVGLAVNGVAILSNQAAPGDDIYNEVGSFDQCQGHPNAHGYHYHTEPYSISSNDSALVGVMRDGYFLYGRKDADGSTPTLDTKGGHTGTTPDEPTKSSYHYHVNEQTSTSSQTAGQKAWFLTSGIFEGAPASCAGCGDMMAVP
jgi:hypothetical protein